MITIRDILPNRKEGSMNKSMVLKSLPWLSCDLSEFFHKNWVQFVTFSKVASLSDWLTGNVLHIT